jgi:hypothetical protein
MTTLPNDEHDSTKDEDDPIGYLRNSFSQASELKYVSEGHHKKGRKRAKAHPNGRSLHSNERALAVRLM